MFYGKDSDRDEIFHHGDLGLSVEAVADWFFVDVGGRYAQSIVDPAQPANRNNLFGVGNLVDTASATITPALRHTFGKVDLLADYTRGFVDYRDTLDDGVALPAQTQDSDNEEANFSLGSAMAAPLSHGWPAIAGSAPSTTRCCRSSTSVQTARSACASRTRCA